MMKKSSLCFWLVLVSVASSAAVAVSPEQAYQFGQQVYQKSCASCHENAQGKAPSRKVLEHVSLTNILMAMEFGKMQPQAAGLSQQEKQAVAFYLGGKPDPNADDWMLAAQCESDTKPDPEGEILSSGWGLSAVNSRYLDHTSSLTQKNIGQLELAWAFAFPKVTQARSQPVLTEDTLFVGSKNGNVFALNRESGCIQWRFKADVSVRSGLVLADTPLRRVLYFADARSQTYALDASNGTLLWKQSVALAQTSVVTGTPAINDDILYVPISSFEVAAAGMPSYPCCQSHGGVVALSIKDGKKLWAWHATPDATIQGKTRNGTPMFGPSGAAVWSTPTIDEKRGLLYIGTGENTSRPVTATSDAIVALDLKTGEQRWVFQALPDDVWNSACLVDGPNCPENAGPDFDFGASVIIAKRSNGKDVLLAGQKSSEIFALDPDANGKVLWRKRLSQGSSNGGVHWGMTVIGSQVFVPIADPERDFPGYEAKPGLYALDIDTGKLNWEQPVTRACEIAPENRPKVGLAEMRSGSKKDLASMYQCSFYYGLSAAPTAVNDLVFAGGLDGKLRAYDPEDGRTVWQAETARPFSTVNGVRGHGGAIDVDGPVVGGDMLFIQSGYSMFGQLPGNVLLAFRLKK